MSLGKPEKYKFFSIPIEIEVTKINEEGNEGVVTISEKVQFIDIARLTATSTA